MFLEDDALAPDGSSRQALSVARGVSPESFEPPCSVTRAALEVIKDRGGVISGEKLMPPPDVEKKLKNYYENSNGLKTIPRGENEPEGQVPIRLREAVVVDTAEEIRRDSNLRERNSTAIRRRSSEYYQKEANRGKFLGEFDFGIAKTGELVEDKTGADTTTVRARLTIDENGNVWKVNFVHPDSLAPVQMKAEIEGNPRHSEILVLASVMEHNLKNAFEKAMEKHIRPAASISNAKYQGNFDSDLWKIRKPLWSAVKAEFPQYALHPTE